MPASIADAPQTPADAFVAAAQRLRALVGGPGTPRLAQPGPGASTMRAWRVLACLPVALAWPTRRHRRRNPPTRCGSPGATRSPIVDPYYNQLRTGLVLAHQAWDTLIYRDPDTFQIKPLLATVLEADGRHHLGVRAAPGVTFHDGSPFTADDVVYTINTVLADQQVAVPSNFAYLAGAEKIDDLHVRVKLKRVFPAALEYMSMTLPIWPKAYRERVGADAYSQAPVGTGPYRITKVDGVSEIDLERNDGYFDGPEGPPGDRQAGHPRGRGRHDGDHRDPRRPRRLDLAVQPRPVREHQPRADPAGGARREHAHRLPAAGRRRPHRGRQPADQAEGAPGHRPRHRPGRRSPANWCKAAAGCWTPPATRRSSAATRPSPPITTTTRQPPSGCWRRPATPTASTPSWSPTCCRNTAAPSRTTSRRSASTPASASCRPAPSCSAPSPGRTRSPPAPGAATRSTTSRRSCRCISTAAATTTPAMRTWSGWWRTAARPRTRTSGARPIADALRRVSDQMYWLPLHTYVTTYAFSRQLNFKPYPDELPRFFLASWR